MEETNKTGDPVLAFRIPPEINESVENLKTEMFGYDGAIGKRTDVGRSILMAVLSNEFVPRLLRICRLRQEPFSATLRSVIKAGLSIVEKATEKENA